MKKNGQFLNVRVEYGFGAVCRGEGIERAAKKTKIPRKR